MKGLLCTERVRYVRREYIDYIQSIVLSYYSYKYHKRPRNIMLHFQPNSWSNHLHNNNSKRSIHNIIAPYFSSTNMVADNYSAPSRVCSSCLSPPLPTIHHLVASGLLGHHPLRSSAPPESQHDTCTTLSLHWSISMLPVTEPPLQR